MIASDLDGLDLSRMCIVTVEWRTTAGAPVYALGARHRSGDMRDILISDYEQVACMVRAQLLQISATIPGAFPWLSRSQLADMRAQLSRILAALPQSVREDIMEAECRGQALLRAAGGL